MSLFKGIDSHFAEEMLRASILCGKSIEEEGGIILGREGYYEFVKIKNIHAGTTTAHGLYEADREEMGIIVSPMVGEGWKIVSSFHTHPSFSATPSRLDLNVLFNGFKHNVIYATERDVFSYSVWTGEELSTVYLTCTSLKQLIDS